jgi:predicted acylesterase/phospholipase RssA
MTFLDKADEAKRQNARKGVRRVLNLALQGGGSHGAFARGVLDRLLEDESLSFEGISGTSAGAANAVVLADGFASVYECKSRDILLVHITPVERPGVPTTSSAIMNRMQEISSNTSLIREMRMSASYNKLIEQGKMGGGKRMLMHVIEARNSLERFRGQAD